MKVGSKEYQALHYWVRKQKGKAIKCEQCGSIKSVQHANLSGEYKKDLEDFMQLCRRCHSEYDWKKIRGRRFGDYSPVELPRKGKKDHRGDKNPHAILNRINVYIILRLHQEDGVSQKELATTFGVNQSSISRIVNRQSWKYVPSPASLEKEDGKRKTSRRRLISLPLS